MVTPQIWNMLLIQQPGRSSAPQQSSMVEREPDRTDEDNSPDLSPYCLRVLGTRPHNPSHELSAPSRLSGPLKSQAVTMLTHRLQPGGLSRPSFQSFTLQNQLQEHVSVPWDVTFLYLLKLL